MRFRQDKWNISEEGRLAGRSCPLGVKLRRTQCEQMSSELPLKADIAQCNRHVSKVPRWLTPHRLTYPFPWFPPLEVFVRRPSECVATVIMGRHPKTFTKGDISRP